MYTRIERLEIPSIAAINGWALGTGLELALACTLRVVSGTAQLGQPEVNLGIIPGAGGTQRLPRLVGMGRAMEMILTGLPVTAEQALSMGLVNRVVPAGQVLEEAQENRRDHFHPSTDGPSVCKRSGAAVRRRFSCGRTCP